MYPSKTITEVEDDTTEAKLPFEDDSWIEELMEPSLGSNQTPSRPSHQAEMSHTPIGEGRPSHKTPTRYVQKNHPAEQIIGNEDAGVETRRRKQFQSPE